MELTARQPSVRIPSTGGSAPVVRGQELTRRFGKGAGGRCPTRRQRRVRARQLHSDHGPFWIRQVHAHAHPGRPRLLHASYNTANGLVILRPADELVGDAYVTISLALTGTLWLVALGVVFATRGRIGLPADSPDVTTRRVRRYRGASRRAETA